MTTREVGRLHVITDETLQSRYSHVELAALAMTGGADTVQFREKRPWGEAERLSTVVAMLRAVEASPVALIVNDSVKVAVASGADGCHLGTRDGDLRTARSSLGARALLGATVNSIADLDAIESGVASYYGVGPVFGTRSKSNPAPRLGVEAFAGIAARCDGPVIAIGNITPERVAEVLDAGAHGVAVLSDVVCSADPADRVFRFAEVLRSAGQMSRA